MACVLCAAVGCGGGDSSAEKPREATLGETQAPPRATVRQRSAPRRTSEPRREVTPRPRIRRWRIPFPPKRRAETEQYTARHYGTASAKLDPKVIVEHISVTSTAQAVYNTFAADVPDTELHELPGVCSHFVIDRDGTIFQLVPLSTVCRHTVGLNDVAIGIEHAGIRDEDVLSDQAQLQASLKLTSWLRCRFHIKMSNVIGHAESLSSPYHHENVPALKTQTHGDFQPASMRKYRADLPPEC